MGAFEVYQAPGETKSLRQVITQKVIGWRNDELPQTFFSNRNRGDYEVNTLACIENLGRVAIFGRINGTDYGQKPPFGYGFYVDQAGNSKLIVSKDDGTISTLGSKTISYSANTWHSLKLRFKGSKITAYVDGNEVLTATDLTYSVGMAGIGSGYNNARFDNLSVTPVAGPQNLALGKTATSSSQWDSSYSASNANDGNVNTRWNAANGTGNGEWVQIDFGINTTFDQVVATQEMNRIGEYQIQYWNGSSWVDCFTGAGSAAMTAKFVPVTASKMRLFVKTTQTDGGYTCPSISELQVYNTGILKVYEAEGASLQHQFGRIDGDGWSENTLNVNPGHLVYGPYATDIPVGYRTATFRLMVDNNSANDDTVAILEVYDATSNTFLGQQSITRKKFTNTFTYQDFALDFNNASAGHSFEFRIWWTSKSYVKVDNITIN